MNQWLGKLTFDEKIVIAGNHDTWLSQNSLLGQGVLSNAIYLDDELVTVEGLRIFGSPWVPVDGGPLPFGLKRHSGELKRVRARIPDKVDILVTHSPPYGTLDREGFGRKEDYPRIGCELLAQRILDVKPKLHVFGHIHGGYGKEIVDKRIKVNASLCDRKYPPNLINKPIVVEV